MAFLAAAPPPPAMEARLALLQREDARVASLFLRLARAATPYCRRSGPQTGMVLHDLAQYAPSARPDAVRLFGLGDRVGVLAVVAGGPAAKAGLEAGDTIVAIDGAALPPSTTRDARDRIERALDAAPAEIGILRAGASIDVRLEGERDCAAHVQVVPSVRYDARANAELVSITTATVELAQDDDELAFLLAHELAHLARGGDPDENEADRLGVRIMAAAGFDPRKAPIILARIAHARGQESRIDMSHPMLRKRLAVLRQLTADDGTSEVPPS